MEKTTEKKVVAKVVSDPATLQTQDRGVISFVAESIADRGDVVVQENILCSSPVMDIGKHSEVEDFRRLAEVEALLRYAKEHSGNIQLIGSEEAGSFKFTSVSYMNHTIRLENEVPADLL
jgi:hypothetical protein